MSFLDECKQNKIVAIVRGVSAECVVELANALYAGGIRMMEITFDQSSEAGIENTLKAIRMLVCEMAGKMKIGAGTVVTAQQVVMAADAGAEFIITPNINADVIKKAKGLSLGCMAGAFTATETEYAYRLGADIVKIFPAADAGPKYIKNIRGPLGYIPMACVGGVDEDNIESFFEAGCCAAGVGGSLVDKKAIAVGDFDKITRAAEKIIAKVGA